MFNSMGNYFKRSLDFRGRATRREFWIQFLFFLAVLGISSGRVEGILFTAEFITPPLVVILSVFFLATAVRRINDVGKSRWLLLVPLYNILILLFEPSMPDSGHER
jgi:uncharacterized membrane protein YhaH (DUF805 family)